MDLLPGKSNKTEKSGYKEIWLNPREVKEALENTRQECKDIEALADSFLLVGQEQPTVLAKIGEEYWIIDGHRRNLANILNLDRGYKEYEKVKYFYKEMTETMYELSLLAGNGFSQDLTPYEKSRLAERMKNVLIKARDEGEIKLEGRIRDIVGAMIGEKPTQMARYEAINNNLTDEAKEQFKKGNIGISAAYETSKLPPEEQKKVAEQVASGEKVQVKEIAEKIQEKKQLETAERIEKAAERAEKAAKKAQDAAVTAAQSTLEAERAAEYADMSASNILEQSKEYVVSDSDTTTGELFDMIRQYPDADVMVKMYDNTAVQVNDVIFLEEYNIIELETKAPCKLCGNYDYEKQPEMPVLKNNTQRAEFIDSYMTWPIWFENELTEERFYRYALENGVAIVVKVHKRHGWDGNGKLDYGLDSYYLTGVKIKFDGSKNIYKLCSSQTFAESKTNKTSLIDYLKEYQKG